VHDPCRFELTRLRRAARCPCSIYSHTPLKRVPSTLEGPSFLGSSSAAGSVVANCGALGRYARRDWCDFRPARWDGSSRTPTNTGPLRGGGGVLAHDIGNPCLKTSETGVSSHGKPAQALWCGDVESQTCYHGGGR
jgi:hypothetical protein